VELLEVQLTMERLLLQDQRAANARQQQQVIKINYLIQRRILIVLFDLQLMQLLAKQRNSMSKHKEPKPSSPQLRSLQPGQAGIVSVPLDVKVIRFFNFLFIYSLFSIELLNSKVFERTLFTKKNSYLEWLAS